MGQGTVRYSLVMDYAKYGSVLQRMVLNKKSFYEIDARTIMI